MKPKKDIRQVYRAGQSLVVTLPPDFIKNSDLSAGDQVEIFFADFLKLKPVSQEDISEELEGSEKIE